MENVQLAPNPRGLVARQGLASYVILLTACDRHEDLLVGLASGADDFMTKPFDTLELQARLRTGARVLDLEARLLDSQESLRIQASRDHLTGLWNRRAILEQLDTDLEACVRREAAVAVALVDVDHFKLVNDTYGHPAGDAVLRQTAKRLGAQVRDGDSIGRYGGEEFLLVLPGCGVEHAGEIAERVRAAVASDPIRYDASSLGVTISIGVASAFAPGADASSLIEAADAALYRAKRNGRNRCETTTLVERRLEAGMVALPRVTMGPH